MQHNRLETFARAGYAARGVVYVLLGIFALTSAFWGGSSQDTSGALSELLDLPFGRVLVALIALGLLGYVLWKLAQGLLNADGEEDDAKGLLARAGDLVSAGANLFLMLTAAKLALNGGGGGGQNGEEAASAWLMQQPFGPAILGLIAAGVVAAGIVQVWYGASGGYRKQLSLPGGEQSWMDQVCRYGLIARGIVLALVGGFLAYAALTVSPEQAAGTTEALTFVHDLPFGRWIYAIVALGLVAFGAYGFIEARYRTIRAPAASGRVKLA